MINFDANATYGLEIDLLEMAKALAVEGLNPSSAHAGGQRARALIEEARDSIRQFVGAAPNAIVVFCSGATEANNLVLLQALESQRLLLTSLYEHPSIAFATQQLAQRGLNAKLIEYGESIVSSFLAAVVELDRNERVLASCMAANNETGELIDLRRLVQQLKALSPEIKVHSDAVQACGKGAFNMLELGLDMVTVSGHKLGALSGTGALICSPDVQLAPMIFGGPQEGHRRAGTENLFGIITLGLAAKRLMLDSQVRAAAMNAVRSHFESMLCATLERVQISCSDRSRIPNTSCFRIPGIRGDDMVVAMDVYGYCISSGSACASGKQDASPALLALGYDELVAKEFVRVSFRHDSKLEDASNLVRAIKAFCDRSWSEGAIENVR